MTGEGSEWRGRLVRLTALQRLSFLASRVAYHRADPHRVDNQIDPAQQMIWWDAAFEIKQIKSCLWSPLC